MQPFDAATMGRAFAAPGMDPRGWVQNGWVAEDTPEQRSVRWRDQSGALIPEGPLVDVVLQPSGVKVTCRVASGVSGVGEGEWHPFLERDEVIVVVPSGDERGGPIIVGRLYNGIDTWPTTVAGMDATQNTFAFKRVRTPYVLEVGPSLMLRSADTGAALTFAPEGNVFLASGDGHLLAMTADVVALQTSGQEAMVQLNPSGKVGLYAKSASFILDEGATQFLTPGTVAIGTSGNGPLDHATSIEAVANVVFQVVKAYNIALAAVCSPVSAPLTGTSLGTLISGITSALGVTVAGGVTAGASGGDPAVSSAVRAGLAATKGPGSPGLGCPGFLIG